MVRPRVEIFRSAVDIQDKPAMRWSLCQVIGVGVRSSQCILLQVQMDLLAGFKAKARSGAMLDLTVLEPY